MDARWESLPARSFCRRGCDSRLCAPAFLESWEDFRVSLDNCRLHCRGHSHVLSTRYGLEGVVGAVWSESLPVVASIAVFSVISPVAPSV